MRPYEKPPRKLAMRLVRWHFIDLSRCNWIANHIKKMMQQIAPKNIRTTVKRIFTYLEMM